MSPPFTLGVEEEFQIVDPATWELRSHVSELMASSNASAFGDLVKPEMHKSIVEVGTKICFNVQELAEEIIKNRRALADAAERVGLRVAAAGTHPFSSWTEQIISEGERYKTIVEELQELARSLLIFGLHVHVGIPDREVAIEVMNEARYFLPHLLALSTSSPFWMGRDTGLKSYRTTIFRRFPRTGIPDRFESWSEYQQYVDLLVQLQSVNDAYRQFDNDREMLERSLDLSSQELLAANAHLRALVGAFPDLILRLDAGGVILDAKGGAHGDPTRKWRAGQRLSDVVESGARTIVAEALTRVTRERAAVSVELELGKESPALLHYEARLLPLDGGEILMILRDVTERYYAEKELQALRSVVVDRSRETGNRRRRVHLGVDELNGRATHQAGEINRLGRGSGRGRNRGGLPMRFDT